MSTVNILKGVYTPLRGPQKVFEPKKLNKDRGKYNVTMEVDYLARQGFGHTDEGSKFTLKVRAYKVELLVAGSKPAVLTKNGSNKWTLRGKAHSQLDHALITHHVRSALRKMSGRRPSEESVSGEEADFDAEPGEVKDRSTTIINNLSCPHCNSSGNLSHVEFKDLTPEIARLRQEVHALRRDVTRLGKQEDSKTHKESVFVLQTMADRVETSATDLLSAIQETQKKQDREIAELRNRVAEQADLSDILQHISSEKDDLQQKYEELTRSSETSAAKKDSANFALLANQHELTERLAQLGEEKQRLQSRLVELNAAQEQTTQTLGQHLEHQDATLANQQTTILQLEREKQNLTTQIATFNDALKDETRKAEAAALKLQNTIKTQTAAISVQEKESRQLQNKIQNLGKNSNNLNSHNAHLENELKRTEKHYHAQLTRIEEEKRQVEMTLQQVRQTLEEEHAQATQLTKDKDALSSELVELTDHLKAAELIANQTAQENTKLKKENNQQKAQIAGLEKEFLQRNQYIVTLVGRLGKLEPKVVELEHKRTQLQNLHAGEKHLAAQLQKDVDRLEQQKQDLLAEQAQLQHQITQEKAAATEQAKSIATLRAHSNELLEARQQTDAIVDQQASKHRQLKSKKAQVKGQLHQVNHELEGARATIANLENDKLSLETEQARLKKTNKERADHILTLTGRVGQLAKKEADLQIALTHVEREKTKVVADLDQLKVKEQVLLQEIQQKSAFCDGHIQSILTLEDELERSKEKMTYELFIAREMNRIHVEDKQKLYTQLDTLRQDAAVKKTHRDQLAADKANLQTALAEVKEKEQKQSKLLEQLKKECNRLIVKSGINFRKQKAQADKALNDIQQLKQDAVTYDVLEHQYHQDEARLKTQIAKLQREKADIEKKLKEMTQLTPVTAAAIVDRPDIIDLPALPPSAPDIDLAQIAAKHLDDALDDLIPPTIPQPSLPAPVAASLKERLNITALKLFKDFTDMHIKIRDADSKTLEHEAELKRLEAQIAQLEAEKQTLAEKAARSNKIANIAVRKMKKVQKTTPISHHGALFQVATGERKRYGLIDKWSDDQLSRDVRRINDIHDLAMCKTELMKETALRRMNRANGETLMWEALDLRGQLGDATYALSTAQNKETRHAAELKQLEEHIAQLDAEKYKLEAEASQSNTAAQIATQKMEETQVQNAALSTQLRQHRRAITLLSQPARRVRAKL